MRYLSWIVSVPLLAIAVIFAVQHRGAVTLDLWPLPFRLEPPLYLAILMAVFAGFLAGGLAVWLAQGRNRSKARERRFRIEELEREVAFLKRKLEKAEAERSDAEARSRPSTPGVAGDAARALPARRTGT